MPKHRRHHPFINYRNAIYQGGFNFNQQQRNGFGILYLSNNHHFIASNWFQDKLNGHTLIFIDSQKYMYGTWFHGQPNGIVYSRFNDTVLICSYQYGSIQQKVVIIFQKYNIAAVVQLTMNQNYQIHTQILSKGQVFSKQHLTQFVNQCNWGQFSQSYQTLVKYISSNLTQESKNRATLELINNSYYRFGFQKIGLAIIFDDYYKIKSVGDHQKHQIKGLGKRYLNQNIVEQGNWALAGQVYAYSSQQKRPKFKLTKIYRNYHLKQLNYVNCQLKNDSFQTYKQLQQIIKGDISRQIIAGMIYTSRKTHQYTSNSLNQRQNSYKDDLYEYDQTKKPQMKSKQEIIIDKLTKQEVQRKKLANIKNQIYQSVMKKQIHKQLHQMEISASLAKSRNQKILSKEQLQENYHKFKNKSRIEDYIVVTEKKKEKQQLNKKQANDAKEDSLDQDSIIRKAPVGNIPLKNTPNRDKSSRAIQNSHSRSRSRSPIFTQKRNYKTSLSATAYSPQVKKQLSPFGEKMRKRINSKEKLFQNPYIIPIGDPQQQKNQKKLLNPSFRPKRHHTIFNETNLKNSNIQKKTAQKKNQINLKDYQSPFDHISLNLSQSKGNKMQQSSIEALPITMKIQKGSFTNYNNNGNNNNNKNKSTIPIKIHDNQPYKKKNNNKPTYEQLFDQYLNLNLNSSLKKQQNKMKKENNSNYQNNNQKNQDIQIILPVDKLTRLINPYEQRQKREQFEQQQLRNRNQQRKSSLKYSSKQSINKFKNSTAKKEKQAEKPMFPVYNNSAYLKQKSIPEAIHYSSPPKSNSINKSKSRSKSPYQYFLNNANQNILSKKTFQQSKYNSKSNTNKRSNKPYYQPIQKNQIEKIKLQQNPNKSKSKSRYYQNQFRKRMDQTPQKKYTKMDVYNEEHKERSPQLNNTKYLKNQPFNNTQVSKKKIINSMNSKSAYNYYFQ